MSHLLIYQDFTYNLLTCTYRKTKPKDLLKSVLFIDQENKECTICLEPFKRYRRVSEMIKCQHIYHTECITEWLMSNQTCPLCRAKPLYNMPQSLKKLVPYHVTD